MKKLAHTIKNIINFFAGRKKQPAQAAAIKTTEEISLKAEEFERCVICGKLTGVRKETPIYLRKNYEEGFGQICYDCNKRLESGEQILIDKKVNEIIKELE